MIGKIRLNLSAEVLTCLVIGEIEPTKLAAHLKLLRTSE
jgi:hypothetical protein